MAVNGQISILICQVQVKVVPPHSRMSVGFAADPGVYTDRL